MTFERNTGIWISDIHRDRIPQLSARYSDRFLSHCCSSIIYMYIRVVSSHSLWYLVSEVKVNLFLHLNLLKHKFLHIKDTSLNCNILLKLIHFKSRNSGWRDLVLNISHCLPLLQQSWCIFVLHTSVFHCPHIELQ